VISKAPQSSPSPQAPVADRSQQYEGTITDEEYARQKSSGGAEPQPQAPAQVEFIKCRKCNYINLPGSSTCISCNASLTDEAVIEEKPFDPPPGVLPFKGTVGVFSQASNHQATIDPYRVKENKACFLELVNRDGEENAIPDIEQTILEFSNEDEAPIELNREKLDPDNFTITSKVQAELSYKNGKWYLQDKSTLNTTFIRVAERTELKEGDIILMGDRKFIFTTEQE
jgi:hypothetical protein